MVKNIVKNIDKVTGCKKGDKMRIYDAFETKSLAEQIAKNLRNIGKSAPQYVRVKPVNQGRLKYGVFIGGKNSGMY